MPRLAIASDFLAGYAKLEKPVQTAVSAAITKFSEHTHAGVHLEKLKDSRDDRIRTIRIDSFWRGVVLAPDTGDTYCLVTVLPHDKAIAYARSRRFSVNQAVGVIEVRDEEALHGLEPALTATAESVPERLFAEVRDSDLTKLGVDESLLPIVRLLTSDAHLDALQSVLPEAQYAALYALACGMTPDEAWAEVAQYLPADAPPSDIDTGDLVAAMERSPGRVAFVSGPEELREILAHPFAAWRIFLHPSQRKIAYRPSYSGPAQVTGGAGTGKTVTALHRSAFLAGRDELPAGAILLTTFTKSLADALQDQLAELAGEAIRARIEVLNVDRLAYRVVRQARGDPKIADAAVLRGRWDLAAEAVGGGLTGAFLEHEWEQVVLAQNLRSEDAYLTCQRPGRGRPLGKDERSRVWRAVEQVQRDLITARQTTHIQLANEAAVVLSETGDALYRHIVVDEAQDLHPSQWRLLRAAVRSGPDDLFIAADPNQRIYDNRVSLASLAIAVRGRSRRLKINYRTTQEILAWSVPILGPNPITGLDDEADTLLGYRSLTHGPRPLLRRAANREEETGKLAEQIGLWIESGIEPSAIGVAARSSYMAGHARAGLKDAGIKTLALTTRSSADAVRVGTMHAMKGLEFQAVAVVGVDEGSVPAGPAVTPAQEDQVAHDQDLQRERCVLFVACTRARDQLYVSYSGQPSPFLAGHPQEH